MSLPGPISVTNVIGPMSLPVTTTLVPSMTSIFAYTILVTMTLVLSMIHQFLSVHYSSDNDPSTINKKHINTNV